LAETSGGLARMTGYRGGLVKETAEIWMPPIALTDTQFF
jgi:hypothetical protein